MPDLMWFNASSRMHKSVRLWNLFNRRQSFGGGGWVWGVGVLQVGHRHLAYVGSQGLCLFFVHVIGRPNTSQPWGRELTS